MAPIKAITLDLDDTLWPIDVVMTNAEATLHAWLERHAPGVARALPPAEFAAFRRALAAETPTIAHDFTSLRREALRRALALHGGDSALAEPALEVFLAARNTIELYPDALAALERLARRYPLVSLSNGNADLVRVGIGHFFAGFVSARSAGFAKPDARIFQAACALAKLGPEEVLHVGDDPALDVIGAAQVGMRTVWVNRARRAWAAGAPPTHEVPDLIALCEWLGA